MVIRRPIATLFEPPRRRQGSSQVPPDPRLPDPPGALPILSVRDLLRARRASIDLLEELAGTTRPHFEAFYLADLARCAAWAQQLPASEAHHHAYPGGLLDHACEVAVAALRIRRGYLLPPGAPPEEAVLKKDLWTYAVFTLALLHDAGKPVVDQVVTVHGNDGTAWPWNPWSGALGDDPKALGYEVAFHRQRDYRAHQQASLLLAPRLLSPEGLAWLASDPDLFGAWLAYAGGDTPRAGVIAEILAKADSESVARSMGATTGPTVMAPRRGVPLHDKLLATLRHLIDTGELPMNRRGAACFRVGDDLWLVSKRGADALRAHLLAEGHTGIPGDNSRLFDVLQDHRLLVPTADDKAVWRMTVQADGQADALSLLRVPVACLWADPEAAPPEFAGTIEPDQAAHPASGGVISTRGRDSGEPIKPETAPDSVPAAPAGAPPKAPAPHAATAGDGACRKTRPAAPRPSPETHPPATPGRQFLDWLATALQAGRLEYNSAKARVHIVPEGVLLASPGLFRDYAEATGTDFEAIQRSFQKLKLHRVTSAGHNVHQYAVADSGAVIKGFLLPEPALIFGGIVPVPNRVLSRL
jgi:integrating conjugative element relaxase (TIGR03760 family)